MQELAFVLFVILLKEAACLVPPHAPRPRHRRHIETGDQPPIDNEAMFQDMHEGLNHPTYSSIAKRPGKPTRTHSCGHVRRVPKKLRKPVVMRPDGLSNFYTKYTEAYGIPVVSSSQVSDGALQRACYVLRYLLADNAKVRRAFYKMSGRVAVIGKDEDTTSIPEHSYLDDWWNWRARGLGATWDIPVSTAGEENCLCLTDDRYHGDDILLHEYLHGLHNLGLNYALEKFEGKMEKLYNIAKNKGMWRNTYAMSTDREYFAESGQSYLNSHIEVIGGNGVHNHVNTREELKEHDPYIYEVMRRVFSCNNEYLPRCDPTKTSEQQREAELNQVLKMDCKMKPIEEVAESEENSHNDHEHGGGNGVEGSADTEYAWAESSSTPATTTSICTDLHEDCVTWADSGECDMNPAFMLYYCAFSCQQC